jgi:multidrug efflux system outer membrane protein
MNGLGSKHDKRVEAGLSSISLITSKRPMKNRTFKSLVLGFSVFLLSACVSIREYKAPSLPKETASIDLTVEDKSNYQVSEPILKWWTEFEDPQLSMLVELSLRDNLDVQVALANLMAAWGLAREVSFDRFPTADARLSYLRTRLSDDTNPFPLPERSIDNYEMGFDASWEIDLFGRVSQRIQAQEAASDAALSELHDVYVVVSAEVARVYIELRGAQYQLYIAQRNLFNQQQLLSLTEQLSNGGRATQLDLARASTQVSLTQATIPPLESTITGAINRLSILTGQVPDALRDSLQSSKVLPKPPVAVAVGDAAALIQRRPDIRVAERLLAQSVAQYNLSTRELFPSVSLIGSIGYSATNFSNIGEQSSAGFIGPSLNWRILDYGRVKAQIDQADTQTLLALARYEQTVLLSLEETQSALTNYTKEQTRAIFLKQAADSAQIAADLAMQRFDQGVDDFLDVLDAERTLLESQDTLAQSETQVNLNLIAIYKALGGGWKPASS